MPMTATSTRETAQIRQHLDTLAQALRSKNSDALMAHYAPDMITFDLRPPLQLHGASAYRKNFDAWFSSVQGPIDYEICDLHITVSGEAAFCHSLCHVESESTTGKAMDYWVRVTSGLHIRNGRWMITHEHVSVPIMMETMQAAVDLQP